MVDTGSVNKTPKNLCLNGIPLFDEVPWAVQNADKVHSHPSTKPSPKGESLWREYMKELMYEFFPDAFVTLEELDDVLARSNSVSLTTRQVLFATTVLSI